MAPPGGYTDEEERAREERERAMQKRQQQQRSKEEAAKQAWDKKHLYATKQRAKDIEIGGQPFADCLKLALEQFQRAEGTMWRRGLPDEASWSGFAASAPGWGGATSCKLIYVVPPSGVHGTQCIFLSKELPFHYDLIQLFAPVFADIAYSGKHTGEGADGAATTLQPPWPRHIPDFNKTFYAPQSAAKAMVLAGITRYPARDKSAPATWALDLNPGDFGLEGGISDQRRQDLQGLLLDLTEHVGQATEGLRDGALHFHAQSFDQRSLLAGSDIESKGMLLSTDQLYEHVSYQPLIQGTAVGVVHLVPKGKSTDDVPRDAICVCEEVPLDLPPVQALLTAAVQTPLAHTALLCANRGTPNAGVPGQFAALVQHSGQLVELVVGAGDYSITPLPPGDPRQPQGARPLQHLPNQPKGPEKLVGIDEAYETHHGEGCGAKARQYGMLRALFAHADVKGKKEEKKTPWPVTVLNSFVIPYTFAEQHFDKCDKKEPNPDEPLPPPPKGTCDKCDGAHYTDECPHYPAARRDGVEVAHKDVKMFRCLRPRDAEAVRTQRVSTGLLKEVRATCLAMHQRRLAGDAFIFRSSTNAEDLEGFNGAGLYESVPVADIRHTTDAGEEQSQLDRIEAALHQVWGSLWTARARAERLEFGMVEDNVRVAVLVQPFVGPASRGATWRPVANGVAVTNWSPAKKRLQGVYINAVAGAGLRATDADLNSKGAVTEQCTVITSRGKDCMDVQMMNSIGGAGGFLDTEAARAIAAAAQTVQQAKDVRSWDIEWMVQEFCEDDGGALPVGARRVVMLQARPFSVGGGAADDACDAYTGKDQPAWASSGTLAHAFCFGHHNAYGMYDIVGMTDFSLCTAAKGEDPPKSGIKTKTGMGCVSIAVCNPWTRAKMDYRCSQVIPETFLTLDSGSYYFAFHCRGGLPMNVVLVTKNLDEFPVIDAEHLTFPKAFVKDPHDCAFHVALLLDMDGAEARVQVRISCVEEGSELVLAQYTLPVADWEDWEDFGKEAPKLLVFAREEGHVADMPEEMTLLTFFHCPPGRCSSWGPRAMQEALMLQDHQG